jgi:hypothetical protein
VPEPMLSNTSMSLTKLLFWIEVATRSLCWRLYPASASIWLSEPNALLYVSKFSFKKFVVSVFPRLA